VEGNYSLDVPGEETVLVFSSVGYVQEEIAVGTQTVIDVSMVPDITALDEIVVVGYGTQKKKDLTGSVASVKGEDIARQATVNTSQALQGVIPGVSVVNNSGAPGSGATLIIRGQGSFSNTPPLVVIDGVIGGDLNSIDPNDIKSLEVLKDASSSAIYGSRAANGVVIVTTKRGKSGESRISFNASYGIQSLARPLDMMTAQQWRDKEVWKYENEGKPIPVNLQDGNFDPSNSTDWQDVLFSSAPQQQYNLSFAGGGPHSNYNLSVGYVDQQGIAVESYYDRLNIRMNSDFKKGKFHFGESIGVSRENSRGGNITSIRAWPAPVFPAIDENGDYGSWSPGWGVVAPEFLIVNNPLAHREISSETNTSIKLLANLFGSFEIIEGLNLKSSIGVSTVTWHNKRFTPVFDVGNGLSTNPTADLSETRGEAHTILWENTLNYKREFGRHSIDAVVGWTRQQNISENLRLIAEGFPSGISNADAAETIHPSSGGSEVRSSLESYLGRINYSYANRYLLTASIRRDGSSRFREDLRWGNYPSFALGWVISEESFFPDIRAVQFLKLRGGYGELGSQNSVGAYQTQNVLAIGGAGVDYILGTPQQFVNGVAQLNLTNSGLLWETSQSTNIGLEANLLEDRFTLIAEYFKKNTKRLQFNAPIPAHIGLGMWRSNVLVNAGDIQNKGFEFSLTYHKRNGDFTFDIGGNLFLLDSKVIKLNTDGDILTGGQYGVSGELANQTEVGRSLANFYLLETDGIFQSVEEVNAHSKDGQLIQPNAGPGDLRFKDLNDDGVINDKDKRYFDGNLPDFEYGINFSARYKSFDLNMIVQGNVGSRIFNGVGRVLHESLARNADHWREDNKGSDVFRPSISDPNKNRGAASDYYLENSSYLRFKIMQLGYSVPQSLLSRLKINSLRLTVTGQNLITFTSFSGYDPENVSFGINRGVNSSLYPLAKTILFGLNVSF
ncbi:MAG: TonB-dependent receptor, partial [Cytophagales bacterium]|nr:TonB-dependent receptor [Cytophagales bacterium]